MSRKKEGVIVGTVFAVTWLFAAVVHAGTPIDETVPASARGMVHVENVAGGVTVTGWDKNEVQVRGTLGDGRVEIDPEDDEVTIEVILPRHSRNTEATHLEISVPRNSDLEIETVSADIEVSDVAGEIEVETVSGRIEVEGLVGSGEFETVSGDVAVNGSAGYFSAESVSGRILVENASGRVEAETTSGRISIEASNVHDLDCATVSGGIDYIGGVKDEGRYNIENFSGTVTLTMPADSDAYFEIETFSGHIESDFGGRVLREDFGPGASLVLDLGDGDDGAEIYVSTFSGNIRLREK